MTSRLNEIAQQNNAIAKFCGWGECDEYGYATTPVGWCSKFDLIPNYFNNLDAMHQAEKMLTDEQWEDYINQLYFITLVSDKFRDRGVIHANPECKTQAFLRAIKIWSWD